MAIPQEIRDTLESNKTMLEHMLEKLNGLPDGLRQALSDHLWASIPQGMEEWGYNPNGLTVTAQPSAASIRRITSVVAFTPSTNATIGNVTGFVQLGSGGRYFPVTAGLSIITPICATLEESERGVLTLGTPQVPASTGSGLLTLALFGDQLPRIGKLA